MTWLWPSWQTSDVSHSRPGALVQELKAGHANSCELCIPIFRTGREEIGMSRLFPALAIAMLLFLSGAAAEDVTAGSISIKDAWSRATPEGANVGVGYLTITNDGDAP